MSNIKYLSKDQNWEDETTTYWFDVDGEKFGVSDTNGNRAIVDSKESPVNLKDPETAHLSSLFSAVTAEIEAV